MGGFAKVDNGFGYEKWLHGRSKVLSFFFKNGEHYAVFYFAGKRKIFFHIYEVFTWGKKKR